LLRINEMARTVHRVPNRALRWRAMLAGALLVAGLSGAAPAAAQDGRFTDSVAVGWVYVPVVVRNDEGYIKDLRQRDFQLFVDNRPTAVESFETGAQAPVSIVFLQDLSGSMGAGYKLESSREAADYFLDAARPGDEFALASFGAGSVQVDVPFTQDAGAAREAIAAWEAWGTTALQDAVAWLPEIALERTSLKRAAILITDGLDNASTIAADKARDLVRKAQLPVYVLGLESGSPYDLDDAGKKIYRNADMLNLLASLSGGHYFPISGPDDLKEACASVLEDLRHQYVLGFSTGGGGSARFHPLRVAVDGRNRKVVSFRRGYTGPAPSVTPAVAGGK
jgi:Ca-activated chloride channel family protein